jgi:hypothetical protein
MLYLLIFISLVVPAFGLWALENGGMAPMLDFPYGYRNGATNAYIVHILCVALGMLLVVSVLRRRTPASAAARRLVFDHRSQQIYLSITAIIFVVLAGVALRSGGWEVLTGAVNKAELRVLRTEQGWVGTVLTMALKWYMPCAFAVLAYVGRDHRLNGLELAAIWVITSALIVTGVSTGFKTTVLFVFQPYLVLRYWRLGLAKATGMILGATAVVFLLAIVFDDSGDLRTTLEALKARVTTYQGDLAWGIWEKATMGDPPPQYGRTYLSIPGSRFLKLAFNVDREQSPATFASYYFGSTATLYGGYPLEGFEKGVNNQATLFGEAVIAAGPKWYPVFSFGSGILLGLLICVLRHHVRRGDPVRGAVWATFLCTNALMWLMGNGVASMFYAINVVSLVGSFYYIQFLLQPRLIKQG